MKKTGKFQTEHEENKTSSGDLPAEQGDDNMKRHITVLFFICILMLAVQGNTYANSSSGKKIVTIVFDDSGSMGAENRYSNANYAIQAFISLLDEEDELYLVYMSDVVRALTADPSNPSPSGLAVKTDLTNPQAAVDQVRNQPWRYAGTPHSSVQVAYNELFNHPDTDPSTSYYLVVLSDGGFMDASNTITIDTAAVQAQFESYYQQLMPNQTRLNTYYLAIGSEAVALTDRPDLNFHALVTVDGQSMIRTIGQMADMISGRYRLDAAEITMIDSRTVSVASPLPLRNIAFLSQGREAAVSAVTGADGTVYQIMRNVTLAPDQYNTDPSLFGNAILADNQGENMPAGTYTVSFTSDVDLNTLTVMFEPALSYQLVFTCQGQEISEEALASLMEGETVTVTGRVVEAGTDNVIDPALISAQTTYRLAYQSGDAVVNETAGQEMSIMLEGGENRIIAEMSMPGFLPVTDDVRFTMESVIYAVQTETERVSSRQNELDDCEAIRFYLTGNGENLSAEAAMRYELSEPVIIGGTLSYDWTRQEDGSYLFQPKGVTDSVGDITVTVSIVGLPDFLTDMGMELQTSAVIESLPKIEYGIEAVQEQTEVRQNELDNCLPIHFYLTADGERMPASEAVKHPLSEPAVSGGVMEYQWYFDEEAGGYVFQPSGETKDIGAYQIKVSCEELEAETEVELTVLLRVQYAIEVIQTEDETAQTALGKLNPILFYITADGRRMTEKEVEELPLKLNAVFDESGFFVWEDIGDRKAGYAKKITVADDGAYCYQPKGKSFFYGDVHLTLTLPGETSAEAYFTIEKDMRIYWVPLGILGFLLFLIWCIIGWIRQPKFHNQIMEIVVYTKFGVGIQESPRIKVMKKRIGLIPWKACRMRVGDMVFVAGENRKILLDKDCVRGRIIYAGKVRFMGRNAGNMNRLVRMMEPTKRDVRLVRGMELYVADDKSAEVVTGYRLTSN